MPSKKPQVTFRLDEQIKTRMETFAKSIGLTQNELALKAMLLGLEQLGCSTSDLLPDKAYDENVAPNVCEASGWVRLSPDEETKLDDAETERILDRRYFVSRNARLVVTRQKTKNGNQQWYEVVPSDFPEDVWDFVIKNKAEYFERRPFTVLKQLSHPLMREAISRYGQDRKLDYYPEQAGKSRDEASVNRRLDHLRESLEDLGWQEPKPEPVAISEPEPVIVPDVPVEPKPPIATHEPETVQATEETVIVRELIFFEEVATRCEVGVLAERDPTTEKSIRKAKRWVREQLKTLPISKLPEFTKRYDSQGVGREPMDDDRATWSKL